MAKLGKLQESNLIPTEVPGIFIKDLPYKLFDGIYKEVNAKLAEEDVIGAVVVLFNDLIVAEDGTKFEDALTPEDVQDNISVRMIQQIMEALPKALGVNEDKLGN